MGNNEGAPRTTDSTRNGWTANRRADTAPTSTIPNQLSRFDEAVPSRLSSITARAQSAIATAQWKRMLVR